jgi:hypothetical protein
MANLDKLIKRLGDTKFTSNLMLFLHIYSGRIKFRKMQCGNLYRQPENLDHQEISDSITTCFEDKEWIMNYIIYFIDQELMGEFREDIDRALAKHITRIGVTNDGTNDNTKEILITENDTPQHI